jgi:hypothetical protein
MDDIVKRLRDGCGCNFPDNTCMAVDECRDAFEAADFIEAQAAQLQEAREALFDLMAEQNGPPLIRRGAQWEKAMARAHAFLAKSQ